MYTLKGFPNLQIRIKVPAPRPSEHLYRCSPRLEEGRGLCAGLVCLLTDSGAPGSMDVAAGAGVYAPADAASIRVDSEFLRAGLNS